jgi:aspartokinase
MWFGILSGHDIPYFRSSDETDSITVVINGEADKRMPSVLASAQQAFGEIDVHEDHIGIVCCVGEGLRTDEGDTYVKAIGAIRNHGIPLRMSTWVPGRISFTIGVPTEHTHNAVRALHDALI